MAEEKNSSQQGVESEPNSTKKFLGNIVVVIFSNILTLVSSILVGFIIPKIMGVTDYGYYKTFTLYTSYINLFHLGFADGIYLKYAGKKYEEIDKKKFTSFTHHLLLLSSSVSLAFIIVGFTLLGQNIGIILIFLGLNVMSSLMTNYYEIVAQTTMRFKKMSGCSVLRCVFTIFSVAGLFLLYKFASATIHYYYYVIATLSISYLIAAWYAITYREITFARGMKFKDIKKEIFDMYKCGFPLLLSNLISQFIFIVDQQFVNIYFDVSTYSAYAFAYSMITLITAATSAISTVLYPTLKKMDEQKVKKQYSKINATLLIFVSFCLTCYFLLVPFVNTFLSDYAPSLETFRIILPGILISSSISVIKYNCYKKIDKIINYFIKSLIVLGLAIAFDLAAYYIFGTTSSISIVSILVLLIWYMLSELYFIRTYQVKWVRNLIYMVLSIALFYGATFIPNSWVGLCVYVSTHLVMTFAIYNKDLIEFLKMYIKK